MGDDGVAGPPAKKRGATRQISKDDGSDSEGDTFVPLESGSFQKASEEVIASRRIVKVRRSAPAPAAPVAPNPFASIRLVAPSASSGLSPVLSTSFAPLAPPQEPLEAVAGKDSVVAPSEAGTKNVVHADKVQDGEANKTQADLESKLVGKNDEAVEGNAQGGAIVVEERRVENGKGEEVTPNPLEIEGGDQQSVEADVKSEVNEPACATITGVFSNNGEGQHDDDEGTGNAEAKGPGLSVQIDESKDEDSVAVPSRNSVDKDVVKDPLPSLGAAIPGSFSFGTAPFSSETPTAFASFSSTWSAFSSGPASGMSLGSGFAFNRAASEGAFASASSAFSNSNGSSFQLFSTQSSSTPLSMGPPAQPPASAIQFQGGNTHTGEEQEKMVFSGDATLFEFVDASWKERGKGELRVNVPLDKTGKARLLMRSKGNYRLILNASLFPDIKMTSMDSRGVTFACVNSAVEEKSGLVTYAVKFKDSLAAGNFRDAVDAHKCPSQGGLKTPENSPSALHGP